MDFRDMDFNGQDVVLDDNTFTGCTFRNCRVIYRGAETLHLSANAFRENVQWVFQGPAGATIAFLAQLYSGMGDGGRNLVEDTFNNIRRGRGKKS